MKLYVDDQRKCPEGWAIARTYKDAIAFVNGNEITTISLDHDLGTKETGADILQYMINMDIVPQEVMIHTANPVGRLYMENMLNAYLIRKNQT